MEILEERRADLHREMVQRADELYRGGEAGLLEVLLSSDSFTELTAKADMMSEVTEDDNVLIAKFARTHLKLEEFRDALLRRKSKISHTTETLKKEAKRLQKQFKSTAVEYRRVKKALARAQARRARARARIVESVATVERPSPSKVRAKVTAGDKACPVDGPVSFVDSWGAPRAGHTHVGVDLMAEYGTPVVAIVSGTVTYAAYDGSGGNMIFVAGDDGNDYWYMHNEQNLVMGGRVSAGQQIATVGDSGNATGIPHVHFEYHPGGGGPVNPYPVAAAAC